MASHSFWHRWRRRLLALFFIVQYHSRMSLLNLRYKARFLSHTEIDAHARSYWNTLVQALTTHRTLNNTLKSAKDKLAGEQVSAVLRVTRQNFTGERWQIALNKAKKRLEKVVFVEETPTQPLDLTTLKAALRSLDTGKIPRVTSTKLKTAWHSFETGALPRITTGKGGTARQSRKLFKIPRHPRITLLIFSLLAFLLLSLSTLNGLTGRALTTIKTVAI